MKTITIKQQMNELYEQFDGQSFVQHDPISIVHHIKSLPSSSIADIELCAILTAMISWGNRKQIITSATSIMNMCNWKPSEFIRLGDCYDVPDTQNIHRTLKGEQFKKVCHELRLFYNKCHSIQHALNTHHQKLSIDELLHTLCHWGRDARLGSPDRNSACKRINMLLRWMIRKDDVDLGLWKSLMIDRTQLYAIMDTHIAQQAMKMGLISYPKDSWKAVLELTDVYRSWDCSDPLKYDFVLMTNNLKRNEHGG